MSSNKTIGSKAAWGKFAGEMIVPVLLCAYGTNYYISVTRLPQPDTNLLLVGPVYWVMILCSVIFAGIKLRETLRQTTGQTLEDDSLDSSDGDKMQVGKAVSFIVLTIAYAVLLPIVGFASTSLVYVFLMLLALGVRSLPALVLIPIVFAGSLWAAMELFLNLRMPVGLLI